MTEPRFRPGDRVRIAARTPSVHHRVPAYAKGRCGVIERVCGRYGQPERLIRANGEPKQRLYRVRVPQSELWVDYAGPPSDCLDVEIFEHWLEPTP